MAIGPHSSSEAAVLEKHELKGTVGSRMQVTMVTPRGSTVDKEVDEIIAPGVEGEFGVLPGHVAFLSALKPGVLTLRSGGERQVFAVGSGYLEVAAGGLTRVLVEAALAPDEIDAGAVKAEETELQQSLKDAAAGTGESNALLLSRLAWAQARLAALGAATRKP